ncbi:MAG: hypothetical protein JXA57_02055, partial [Armatimonadetes bacterium]|nr:hypothetical protein [Armatimonadota bacterium]
AAIVDVTEGDVTGISIDLGVLPPPPSTVPVSVPSDPPSTLATTTTIGGWQFFSLGMDDNGRTLSARMGDVLSVVLPLHPASALTARWAEPDPEEWLVDYAEAYEDSSFYARYHPLRTGTLRLLVEYVDGKSAVQSTWSVDIEVTD